ncbi:MFS transporter small subunit [Aquipuribacter sp. SD81]
MSDGDSVPSDGDSASSGERTAAVFLWVVVGAGLVYGVAETVSRVTQLFG